MGQGYIQVTIRKILLDRNPFSCNISSPKLHESLLHFIAMVRKVCAKFRVKDKQKAKTSQLKLQKIQAFASHWFTDAESVQGVLLDCRRSYIHIYSTLIANKISEVITSLSGSRRSYEDYQCRGGHVHTAGNRRLQISD